MDVLRTHLVVPDKDYDYDMQLLHMKYMKMLVTLPVHTGAVTEHVQHPQTQGRHSPPPTLSKGPSGPQVPW